jgi:hypothetical protein
MCVNRCYNDFIGEVMKVRTGILAGQELGDTVADISRLVGVDRLAKAYEQATGKPCGCAERQEKLNNLSLPSLGIVLS